MCTSLVPPTSSLVESGRGPFDTPGKRRDFCQARRAAPRIGVVCALSLIAEAVLAAAPVRIDIPAQPAPAALRAFAAQADMQLLYEYEAVKSAHTNRLVGRFGKEEALRLLLRGTGLEVVFSGENAASIRPARAALHAPASATGKTRDTGGRDRIADAGQPERDRAARGADPLSLVLEETGDLEEVLVTGSRIRRIAFDTLQPTTVFTGLDVDERALTSTADIFNSLPSFGPPGNSPVGRQSSIAVGQSFANFLGLGSQRTLTLVDGRRFVAANTPSINAATAPGLQVDLNTIPAALIERVEIIAVGGAPIYGADAVAGTVNIVRKKDFTGFDGVVQSGYPEHGGAPKRRVAGVYGWPFDDGRGNLALSLDHSTQDGLKARQRAATAQALTFQAPADLNSPYQQVMIANSRVALVNFNGLPLTAPVPNVADNFRFAVRDAAGRPQQFAADGSLILYDPGTATGSAVFRSGGDGLNLAEVTSLLTDSTRTLANAFLDYHLTETTRLNVEGWHARTSATEVANQPGFNESSFRTPEETPTNVLQGPIPLRLDNPFLSAAARALIARNLDANQDGVADPNIDFDGDGIAETPGLWLAKGHGDLYGSNTSQGEQTMYRGVAGLEGAVELAGRSFDWELYYVYGRVRSVSANRVILNAQFNRAIDAVFDPASGRIRCRDTNDAACVPLNVLGPGAPSAAAASYVTTIARTRTQIEQQVASANVSGSPISLASGVVGFAAGIEYRREHSEFRPDAILASGAARSLPVAAVSGSFDTKEIYAEATLPLVGPHQEWPLVRQLDLEGAARYVEHTTAGGATTWTAGLRFAPLNALRLRGNYTESIRAPAITELFLPVARIFALATDPCDQRFVNQGEHPARRAANCAAAGIGQPFSSTIADATQSMSVEGNRELRNETAKAWSIGAVLQPTFAPGLTVSADWIDIRLRDAIEPLNATTILQSCYDSNDFPDASVCSRFARDGNGQIVGMRTGFLNAGVVNFAGLTADASYRLDLGVRGQLALGANYFHLDRLDVSVTGSDFNPSAGEISNSQDRATAHLTYRNGPLRASMTAQYIGAAVFDRADGPNTRDRKGVDPFWVFNTGLGYAVSDAFTAQLNVDNVLDDEPPFGSMVRTSGEGASYATATYFPGLLGRSYTLSLRLSF